MDYLSSLLKHACKTPQYCTTLWFEVIGIIGHQITKPSTIDSNVWENINNFFQTVAVTDSHHSADTYVPPISVDSSGSVKDSFHFDRIEPSKVVSLLRKLDIKKSTGNDGLSALFLKQVAEEIAVPLTYLYNKSLSTGSLPAGWKKSNVTPVHKGGSTDDPGNYRPISVVPIVAKLRKGYCFSAQFILGEPSATERSSGCL